MGVPAHQGLQSKEPWATLGAASTGQRPGSGLHGAQHPLRADYPQLRLRPEWDPAGAEAGVRAVTDHTPEAAGKFFLKDRVPHWSSAASSLPAQALLRLASRQG